MRPILVAVVACLSGCSAAAGDLDGGATERDAARLDAPPADVCEAPPRGWDVATFASCDDYREVLLSRLELATGCTGDEECGQTVPGTSCGCTRDLAVRCGIDTAYLSDLVRADPAGCEEWGSTCDCPAAEGFACIEGRCALRFGGSPPPTTCADPARTPAYWPFAGGCECDEPYLHFVVTFDDEGVAIDVAPGAGVADRWTPEVEACFRDLISAGRFGAHCYPRLRGRAVVLDTNSCTI